MKEFKMPSLGADMESGTLYEWLVKPGDQVSRGDIIAEIETAKGVIEIEVFDDGVIAELLIEEGTEVPVGTVLALIRVEAGAEEEEVVPAVAKTAEGTAKEEPHPMDHRPLVAAGSSAAKANGRPGGTVRRLRISPRAKKLAAELGLDLAVLKGTGPGGAISYDDVAREADRLKERPQPRATPLARRLAQDLGVDLTLLTGSGPQGAICKDDVQQAAAETQAQAETPLKEKKAAKEKSRLGSAESMRQAIALAMARSNRDIPHYYLETQIDMSRPLRWLEAENLKRSMKDRLLPAVILIKAVAKALGETPELNGFWREQGLEVSPAIHIGFAIALRKGGLVTPAIHDTDRLSLDEIKDKLRDLIMRTRAGRLRGSELTDATITVTSLGDLGVEKVFGVIYPPQIALVGLGKVMERPWAENGMVGVRPIMSATLAGDHRASDGLIGARFLDALNRNLQEIETL